MIYKINKQSLLEEFGNLDYSPRSLDKNGFVMSAMRNKINGNKPNYKDDPIGPKFGEPSRINERDNHPLNQPVINRSHSLDQSNIHNTENLSPSLGH